MGSEQKNLYHLDVMFNSLRLLSSRAEDLRTLNARFKIGVASSEMKHCVCGEWTETLVQ